jgi:type I restriction enzyme S subunit
MRDPSAMECRGWSDCALGDAFRINRESVVPLAAPAVEFVHYSIPAWDAARAPALQRGAEIESNKTAIRSSSVLVSKLNPRKPRVAVVIDPPEHTCCSTEFICYQPKRDSDDLRFWSAYFASNDFAGRLANIAIGSTNSHTRAAPPETLAWRVPDVPGAEQRTIARVLDTLDTAIHRTEAIIAKLKQVKQGLLHDLLTRGIDANGELRPPQSQAPHLYKPSPLGWIPKEWDLCPLIDVSTRVTDGTHQAVTTVANGVGEVPFLFVSCIRDGQIAWDKAAYISADDYERISTGRKPAVGMVLSTAVGSYGEAAEVVDCRPFAFQRHIACIYPDRAFVVPSFMPLVLNSGRHRRHADRVALGNAQKTVTLGDLSRFPLVRPDLSEQQEIVCRASALQGNLVAESIALEKLRLQKSGLMDDLLTGRVRVTPLLDSSAA